MKHVLVVEDDPDIVSLLVHHLSRRGFRVTVAFDGEEGYRSAVSCPPDLVLLDLLLPVADGHRVLELLRATPATARVPVLIVSALRASDERLYRTMGRANGYVEKPFEIDEVMVRVEAMLGPSENLWISS